MSPPLIEFSFRNPGQFPAPFPASERLPKWLRDMHPTAHARGVGPVPTLKAEGGIAAAMSTGFIIPLVYDCEFTREPSGAVSFKAKGVPIDTQDHLQYRGTWFEKMVVIKFWNPWVMRTPPGYCTLVLPAINRFEIPFEPLAGVIESDSYYLEVFFPTLCLMRPGQTVELKKGTPLVQVVPVPREPWRSMVGEVGMLPTEAFGAK